MTEEKDKWFVEIEKADNGFILKRGNDEGGITTEIFQFGESTSKEEQDKIEKEKLIDLFREIQEHFGIFNQKYDKYHLHMEVIKVKND